MDELFGPTSQVPKTNNNEGVFVPTFSKSHDSDEVHIPEGMVFPPPPGKLFDIKIFAPILGVMFYKAKVRQNEERRTA